MVRSSHRVFDQSSEAMTKFYPGGAIDASTLSRIFVPSGVKHVVPRAGPLICERPDAWDKEKQVFVRKDVS